MTIKCHLAVVRDVRRPGHVGTRGGTCTDVAGAASQVSSQAGGEVQTVLAYNGNLHRSSTTV